MRDLNQRSKPTLDQERSEVLQQLEDWLETPMLVLGFAWLGLFIVELVWGLNPRFGLHRFGQGTLLGVYRWLILSLISYILAHWAYLSTAMPAASCANAPTNLPDWAQAAEIAFQTIFPHLVVLLLLQHIERLRNLALSQGIDIQISRCKI